MRCRAAAQVAGMDGLAEHFWLRVMADRRISESAIRELAAWEAGARSSYAVSAPEPPTEGEIVARLARARGVLPLPVAARLDRTLKPYLGSSGA